MDEAARIIQCIAVDRHSRPACRLEVDHEIAERDRHVDRLDIGPRHHDIFDTNLAEPQDIVQHGPFFGREGTADAGVGHQRIRKILPQALALCGSHETHHPRPKGTLASGKVVAPERTTVFFRGSVRTGLALMGSNGRYVVHRSRSLIGSCPA